MARNLAAKGHAVRGWDASTAAQDAADAAGLPIASGMQEALAGADAIITMLPDGPIVRAVYLGDGGVLALAPSGALLIDSSTIDVATAREVHAAAAGRGFAMVDAPVSGGVAGAGAGTLTFMVGGEPEAFARARPILEGMGKAIVHAGPAGNGQAAKICNNMMLGIQMISVCEAFLLAERLGLAAEKLFEISSQASGQCWSLTRYCPVPGPLPATPANSGYKPGFAAAMMLKDLKLAQGAAADSGIETPLGAEAEALYAAWCAEGGAGRDFSGIIEWLRGYGKHQGQPR
jgi:3-hydroxyisobutyrate dehydrogenase